jgi:hypothetical protein
MRSVSVFSVSALLVAVGCEGTRPTLIGPDGDLQATRSAAGSTIPFKTSSYTFRVTGAAPEAGCDASGESRVYATGKGAATHLGRYTVTLSFCSHPDGTLTEGRGTFVAANGDLLNFTFHGTSAFIPPSSLDFTSFATFTGGTGRFEDAGGEATVTGSVDLGTGAGDGRWEGTITSVGSSGRWAIP